MKGVPEGFEELVRGGDIKRSADRIPISSPVTVANNPKFEAQGMTYSGVH